MSVTFYPEDNLPAPRRLHSDWYRPDYYEQLVAAGGVARNPLGPDIPFDPSEPTEYKKSSVTDRSDAPINIARDTSWVRSPRERSVPE
jgi:hypothetical protein